MALARKSKFDPAHPAAEGFLAMLPLNSVGMELLALDAFEATKPNVKFLAKPGERPKSIYWWVIFAPGFGATSTALFMEKLASEQYAGLDIYARTATDEGRNFLQVLGFTEGTQIGDTPTPHLWIFRRKRETPLYDSYVPNSGKKDIGITVARTFDDLMRVAAVRNSVYIGEQECPFDEEYDGNDLAATHLLAYIGDEPVGCLRLRFFADFAKFERMAIRKEYRKSHAALQLARAGFKICQKKGYSRVYGHVQERLVPFWSRFGFRMRENTRRFVFSDYEYIEIVADIERDSEAVSLESDPYVVIRPEGRWHIPGILEESAARAATNPSAAKKR
jgi:predicted GNAT family N-acyltransferase